MGKRGPQPTPKKVLELRGSWRGKVRGDEPKVDRAKPACPKWLHPIAKRVWRELLPQLYGPGIIAKLDRYVFARYCQLFARWRECEESLMRNGTVYQTVEGGYKARPEAGMANQLVEHLRKLENLLGLNPSARAALAKPIENPEENRGKDRFFSKPGVQVS